MSVVLMSALNWLGYATAGVTVTAIAIWLLLRLCPVRSPAIQRFAWLLVLLPGAVVWRMSVVLPILPTTLFSSVDARSESEGRPMSEAGARSPSRRGLSDGNGFSIASHGMSGVLACTVVLGGWTAGMIMLAARWTWSHVAFVRGLQSPLSPADEWVAELRDVCEGIDLSRQIPLHVTERLGPALCLASGGYRLLVPRGPWGRFSTQQRRSILRHELAHYVRGDLWKSLLVRLLASPQWFNPLAWLAVRRFEEAAECACDDVVVSAEPEDAFEYLRALLELGTNDFSTSTLQAAVRGGSLERRVRRLLSRTGEDSVIKKLVVIAAALLLVTGGFARIRFASAYSPARQNESAEQERADITPATPPAVSLIANGGFEELQEESEDPKAWFATRLPPTAGHFLLAASPSDMHGGQRSVLLAIGDNHPELKVFYNWTAQAKGWQAGETYELSGWIKVENANHPAAIVAQCWSEDGRRILGGASTQTNLPVTGTTDWTRVSTRLNVPEGTSVVRIRAGLSSQDNRGAKAWFDDISLVPVAN
jgi:beta-lactamase regulating signal transducer with metallopeptidase domain